MSFVLFMSGVGAVVVALLLALGHINLLIGFLVLVGIGLILGSKM